jgi:hypothetical protein
MTYADHLLSLVCRAGWALWRWSGYRFRRCPVCRRWYWCGRYQGWACFSRECRTTAARILCTADQSSKAGMTSQQKHQLDSLLAIFDEDDIVFTDEEVELLITLDERRDCLMSETQERALSHLAYSHRIGETA